MEIKNLKATAKKLVIGNKAVKLLVMLGLCGVVLIALSSFFGRKEEQTEVKPSTLVFEDSDGDYVERLEGELCQMVRAVTGEESPTVLVTLETGVRYIYAVDEKSSDREQEGKAESESAHVLLKAADGSQLPLTVTVQEPKVKGVVIVSAHAGDPVVREKLVSAVRAALNLSSARVCVTEGSQIQ